jgi:hypothetical protein
VDLGAVIQTMMPGGEAACDGRAAPRGDDPARGTPSSANMAGSLPCQFRMSGRWLG